MKLFYLDNGLLNESFISARRDSATRSVAKEQESEDGHIYLYAFSFSSPNHREPTFANTCGVLFLLILQVECISDRKTPALLVSVPSELLYFAHFSKL